MYKNIGWAFVWTGVVLLTAAGGRWAVSPGAARQVSFGEFLERQFVTTVSAQGTQTLNCTIQDGYVASTRNVAAAVGHSFYAPCSGASAGVTWTFDGLPPGIQKVQTNQAVYLSGNPTQSGTFTIRFTAFTNVCITSPCPQPTGTLTVTIGPRLAVTEQNGSSLPDARVGSFYTYTFGSSGGKGTRRWTAASDLRGLAFNTTTGVLSGIPQSAAIFPIQVTVTDGGGSDGDITTATSLVYLAVRSVTTPLSMACSPATGPARVGEFYRTICNVSGGTLPWGWSVIGALPIGLDRSSTNVEGGSVPTFVISGTPASSGSYSFIVRVTDSTATPQSVSQTFSGTILSATTALTMSCSPTTGPTQVDVVYVSSCGVSGGRAPYNWSVIGGPSGIALNTTSGSFVTLGGVPTSSGNYNFTVRVTDASEQAATQAFSGTIAPATPPPSISCNPSDGPTKVGIAYSSSCVVSGGTAPYSWSLSSAPSGIGLDSTTGTAVAVRGTATTLGAYFTTLTVTDNRSLTATKTFSGNITTSEPSILNVSPNSLTFSARQGQLDISPRSLSIFAGAGSTFTVTTSGGSWLFATPQTGQTPGSVNVNVSPGSLSPGLYSGLVLVSVPGSTPSSFSVPVTLTIQPVSATPSLAVSPGFLTLTSVAGGPSETRQVIVSNPGGGTLSYTVLAAAGAPWLRLGSTAGSVGSGLSSSFDVTVNPAGLQPGTYQSSLDIRAGTETRTLRVTLLLSGQSQSMLLTQSGMKFTALARGTAAPAQTFGIVNLGVGTMNWRTSATTFSGGNWLRVSPSEGSSQGGSSNVPLVAVSVDPTALGEGQYFGTIQVQAPGAGNSPQVVSVLLDVLGDSKTPPPIINPTGVILFSDAASASRTVTVSNVGRIPLTFTSLASTEDGPNWLTQSPASGTVPANGSLDISLRASASGLSSGVRRGVSRIAFNDGTVQDLAVAFIVAPTAGNSGISSRGAAEDTLLRSAACDVFELVSRDVQNGATFTLSQAYKISIEVRSCNGSPLEVSATADFLKAGRRSNGMLIPMTNLKNGFYEATWTPSSTDIVGILLSAVAIGSSGRQRELELSSIRVNANSNTLQPRADGVFNSASYRPEQVIAPGSWTSIFGEQLADGQQLASTVPFPVSLQATEVKLADISLPVYFVNATQVNALVPWELNPNTTQSLQVVRRGSTAATPLQVSVADRSPGIYTVAQNGQGQGAIVIAGTGIVVAPTGSGTRPANRGEYIEIYATGLGPVSNTPANGAPAPSREPLARTVLQPVITIGGVTAQPIFSGLAPGFVGLYQVNVQVPANAPVGNDISVSLAIGNAVSNTVSIAIR